MEIAVVGCGAMGSIYAALLASAGNDVLVVDAWQAHVDAINRHGLRVEGASGDRTVSVAAHRTVPSRKVDLVVLAVKAAHVAETAPELNRLIGPDTVVLTIQNGVGSADELARHVPSDRLAVGVAKAFGASMKGPGHAFHNSMNELRVGAYAELRRERLDRVTATWRQAGFNAGSVDDVIAMQWEKLICNVAYSAPCALTGLPVGKVMDDPDIGPVSRAAAVEAWTVARAAGIAIEVADPVHLVRTFAAGMPEARPSLLQDFAARRPGEIDVINGAVPRTGERVGVATPVNSTLVALIKNAERSF